MIKAPIEQDLQKYCDLLLKDLRDEYPNSKDTFTFRKGGKYYKIIEQTPYESVHSFVDEEGNVYKPAGWKSPAKGIRARLEDIVSGKTRVDWSGGYLYSNWYRGIRENMNNEISDKEIFDILGIDEDNRRTSKHLLNQFRELAKKYDENFIWLKDDVGIYIKGDVVDETEDLAVVAERIEETLKEDYDEENIEELETCKDGLGNDLHIGDTIVAIDYNKDISVGIVENIRKESEDLIMVTFKENDDIYLSSIRSKSVYKFDTKFGYISGYKDTRQQPSFTNSRKEIMDAYVGFNYWSSDMYGQGGEKIFKAFDE